MFGFFYCCGNVSLYEYITVLLLIDIFFRSFDLCIRAPQDHPHDGWCTRKTCCVNSYSDLWIMPLWSFSCLLVFSWGLFCWVCAQSGLLNLRGCLIQLGWVMPNLIPQQCVRSHPPPVFTHTFVLIVVNFSDWCVCTDDLLRFYFVIAFVIIREVEHLFIYLVDAAITSLGKCL